MLQYLVCRDHVLLDQAKDRYGRRKIHFHHQFAQHFQSKHVKWESPKHN